MKHGLLTLTLLVCTTSWAADEYELYREAGSRCGPELERAARTGFTRWAQWKGRDKSAYQDARQAFDRLYESGCEDGLVEYRYGNLLRWSGRCDLAIPVIERALPDLEANYPADRNALAHYVLGLCSTEEGDFDAAIRHYRRAIELDPDDVNSMLNLANRYIEAGKPDLARELLDHAEHSRNLGQYGKRVVKQLRSRL